MTYLELRNSIQPNIFTFLDAVKYSPNENRGTVKTQLARFTKRGLLTSFKRGWYCFDKSAIDPFDLAGRLYQPSYISLETALHYYGLIPDIPQAVISVTTVTTKKFKNIFGTFYYTKIKPGLFFGFIKVKSANSNAFFNMAKKEKALLDYFYLRRERNASFLRLNLAAIDLAIYRKYKKFFPSWLPKL